MKVGALVLIVLLGLVGYIWLLGYMVALVAGWFGIELAVWQGAVAAVVVNALVGGGARR